MRDFLYKYIGTIIGAGVGGACAYVSDWSLIMGALAIIIGIVAGFLLDVLIPTNLDRHE